jgi:DNA-binding NtrC family response regulator
MDVVTYLHQQKKIENMWVVIISANLTKKAVIKLEKFNITNFIPKPFDKDKFMSVVLPIFSELEEDFEEL